MEIIINKLTMRNFKGVLGEKVVEFAPTVTKVYGMNRTGKTTIADAFRWCLFGKNSEGKAAFGIKTRDGEGNPIAELTHEVQVDLTVDGASVVLLRSLAEKWSKPKNQPAKVLTGHTTSYYVNGQLYTERDFNEYINSLCSESMFLAITNPTYFPSLTPDKQRALLTGMVEDVSMESVAQGNSALENVLKVMDGKDVVAFRQHLSYQMKSVKEELERIPVRISEQKNDIAGLQPETTDWATVQGDLQATEQALARIAEQIAEIIADQSKAQETAAQAKRAELERVQGEMNAVRSQIAEKRNAHAEQYSKENGKRVEDGYKARAAVDEAERALKQAQAKRAQAKADWDAYIQQRGGMEARRNEFKQRWAQVESQQFTVDESQFVCPTCGRPLEAEDIAAKRAELLANFNRNKAQQLDEMEREAERIKQQFETLAQNEQAAHLAMTEQDALLPDLQAKLEQAKAQQQEQATVQVASVDERMAADSSMAELNGQLHTLDTYYKELLQSAAPQTTASEAVQGLQADQQQLQAKRDQLKAQLAIRDTIASKNKRITELEKQESDLNAQLTELEGQDYAAETLMQGVIEELERRVNQLFKFVRFTMFDHRINGALKPTCECTVGGVPYTDLNNADRINAGIDIINAICTHSGVYAPCFIDNAESINEVMPMCSQRIDLIVSEDRELRVIK